MIEGAITVTTNVTGAAVTVTSGSSVVATGAAVGTTFTTGKVANGTYTVKVSAPGYKDATKEVVVNDDVAINVELEKVSFEAAQVGRQTIKVTGDDLTDKVADYVLKKGKSTVSIASVKLSDDKKSAIVTGASSNLTEGDYTICFNKGVEYPLTVKAETVDKIEVVGNTLVPTSDYNGSDKKDVTVEFKVLNQFGEKMAGTITPTSTLGTATLATAPTKDKNGVIKVTLTTAASLGVTKGTLVLVETATGKSTTAELVVGTKAAISKIDMLGLYDISDTNNAKAVDKMVTKDDPSKYALLVKAYDQYGNSLSTIKGGSSSPEATISVNGLSDLSIAANDYSDVVKVNGVDYIKIPFVSGTLNTAGKAVVTIVGNSVGLLAKQEITVEKKAEVEDLTIAPVDTLYVGTKTEVEFTAKDTTGKEVKDFKTLNALGADKFGGNGDFKWERQKDGSAKLFIEPSEKADSATFITGTSSAPTGKDSKSVVFMTTCGSNIHTYTIPVYAKKKATAIVGLNSNVAKAALVGGNALELKQEDFVIQDQYGNNMTADEVAARVSDGLYIRAFKKASGTGFADTYDTEATTIYTKIGGKSIPVFTCNTDDTAGTSTFTFCLATANAKSSEEGDNFVPNSDFDVTLQSVEMKNITDFEVSGVDSIYYKNSTSTANVEDSVDLTVTGKSAGVIVNIPSTKYTIIESAHIKVESQKIKTEASTGVDTDLKNDVKETIEVVIDNAEGTSIKKEITVSIVEPKATTIFDQKDLADDTLTKETAKKLNTLTSTAKVKNQYGHESTIDLANARATVDLSTVPSDWKVEFNNTANAAIKATSKSTTTEAYVDVTYTLSSGLTYTGTVKLTVQ